MSLLLISWLACAGPSKNGSAQEATPGEEGLGDPMIEMGTGEWEWATLDGVPEIPIIQGPQGGFHFLGSVRVSGIEPGDATDLSNPNNPTTTFSVWVDGEDLTLTGMYVQGLDPAPQTARPFRYEMVGRFVIMDILTDEEIDGVEFEMSVAVTDVHGTQLETSQVFTAYPHPFNH